ncbi:hypothetical protein ACLOJK_013173 [Asimina triloba]
MNCSDFCNQAPTTPGTAQAVPTKGKKVGKGEFQPEKPISFLTLIRSSINIEIESENIKFNENAAPTEPEMAGEGKGGERHVAIACLAIRKRKEFGVNREHLQYRDRFCTVFDRQGPLRDRSRSARGRSQEREGWWRNLTWWTNEGNGGGGRNFRAAEEEEEGLEGREKSSSSALCLWVCNDASRVDFRLGVSFYYWLGRSTYL